MTSRKVSWEIVIAGLVFVGIAIYLLDQNSSAQSTRPVPAPRHPSHAPAPPEPHMPSTIVIDLKNLENLRSLENLKNLENLRNLENLEIRLKNLDSILESRQPDKAAREALERSLRQLEEELQQVEKADFKVKLQNNKVYINRNYDVQTSAWTEASPGVFVFKESIDAENLHSMDLKAGFGNLVIVGSDNSQAELLVRATGGVRSSEEINQQLSVSKSLRSGKAAFSVLPVAGSGSRENLNVETTLTLPRNADIDASTSGGHINVNGLNGSHNFVTAGGHIVLNDIEGTTTAKTSGGHITGENVSGDFTLSTSGGHIRISRGSGQISAQTGGGNVELANVNGNIDAKTSGGNIMAAVQQISGPLTLATSVGNIVLSMPASVSADLTARCTSISLAPAFHFEGSKTNGNISGTLNGGGVPITLSCGYGNVTIKNEQ